MRLLLLGEAFDYNDPTYRGIDRHSFIDNLDCRLTAELNDLVVEYFDAIYKNGSCQDINIIRKILSYISSNSEKLKTIDLIQILFNEDSNSDLWGEMRFSGFDCVVSGSGPSLLNFKQDVTVAAKQNLSRDDFTAAISGWYPHLNEFRLFNQQSDAMEFLRRVRRAATINEYITDMPAGLYKSVGLYLVESS